jgi:26S proteasome regulatory subunit N1
MTSIPKPLKFLVPHYDQIKIIYGRMSPTPIKTQLASFLSVLATTMAPEESREALHFLLDGDISDMVNWGQEYIRNLSCDIREEWSIRVKAEQSTDDLVKVIDVSVEY